MTRLRQPILTWIGLTLFSALLGCSGAVGSGDGSQDLALSGPSLVQDKGLELYSGNKSGTTTFAKATTAGNLIAVEVLWDGSGTPTLSDNKGDTFAAANTRATWSGNARAQVFYAKNIVGGATSVTVSFSAALASFGIVQSHEYTGLDKANPLDGVSTQTGVTNTASSGNVTTTGSRDVLFAASGALGAIGATPSGWTRRLDTAGNVTADKVTAAAGTYSISVSATGNQWVMQLVAFKAGSSGGDSTPPSVPTALSAQVVSSTRINLAWTASADNVGVTGYKVYRGGVFLKTTATTSLSDTGLTPSTAYRYAVSAVDAAGNESAQTAAVQATTSSSSGGDTTAPVVSLSAPAANATVSGTVTVSANASDSGSGVHDVKFLLDGNALNDDTSAPYGYSWNTTTVANGTHQLTAVATDNAGNVSAATAPITVTVNNRTGGTVPNPLRVMALGDSLTQGGVNGGISGMEPSTLNGYRFDLLTLLTAAGYNVDYVGSWQLGDSRLADQWENGFSGACIKVSPCGGGTLYPQTAAWITSETPGLVIMQGGGNDFSDPSLTDAQAAQSMESWIQLVWATDPNIKIIVSGSIWHDVYDGLIHDYVDGLQAQGKAIRWVPYGDDIEKIDLTHPSAAGYSTWANELAPMVEQLFPQ